MLTQDASLLGALGFFLCAALLLNLAFLLNELAHGALFISRRFRRMQEIKQAHGYSISLAAWNHTTVPTTRTGPSSMPKIMSS